VAHFAHSAGHPYSKCLASLRRDTGHVAFRNPTPFQTETVPQLPISTKIAGIVLSYEETGDQLTIVAAYTGPGVVNIASDWTPLPY
jgi:hypothetical protein